MFQIVTGGSGSGKSAYAETLAMQLAKRRFYIATMYPFGEEYKKKIKRHQKMRAKKQFETIECYTGLKEVELPEEKAVEQIPEESRQKECQEQE